MIWENRQSVTNELVEFEESPIEVQDCRKITNHFRVVFRTYKWTGWVWEITSWTTWKFTDHFRGIYGVCPNLVKENRRMSTRNRLDLQTLGSQPIMPKNLPNHGSSSCWYLTANSNIYYGTVLGCPLLSAMAPPKAWPKGWEEECYYKCSTTFPLNCGDVDSSTNCTQCENIEL